MRRTLREVARRSTRLDTTLEPDMADALTTWTAARRFTASCCVLAAALLTPALAQADELPLPRGGRLLGQAHGAPTPSGQSVGVVVYIQNERNYADEPVQKLYVDVLVGKSGATPRRRVLRRELPEGFANNYRYRLETIDLKRGDGRWVLRFEADPDAKGLASDRDRFVMFMAGSARARELAVISVGRQDGIDPKQLVTFEDIDQDGELEVIQIDKGRSIATCGDSWEKLFPLVWDFDGSRFKPAPLALALNNQAPVVTARFSDAAPISSHFPSKTRFHTSSSDYSDLKAPPGSRLSRPTALSNNDLSQGWTEGAPGFGRGEFVTARVNPAFPIQGLRIVPGLVSSEARFVHHAVPRRLLLSFEDGTMVQVELPEADRVKLREEGGLYVELPAPVQSDCVTVTILDVWPPKRKLPRRGRDDGAHTSLTEITPLNTMDFEERAAVIQKLVDQMLADKSSTRRRALETLAQDLGREMGPVIMKAQEEELAKPIADAHPERLLALLNLLEPDEALEFMEKLLDYPGVRSYHLATLQRNVAFKGRAYIEPLFELALDEERSERVRSSAARIVSRAAPPERMLELLPLLGIERAELRKSVVRGLTRAGFDAVDTLLGIAADPKTSALAAHDALWAVERISRARFRGEPGKLPGGERLMTAYTNHDDVQLKIRALRLLRSVRVNNGDAFLATVLKSQTQRPEVQALAAEGLALYPTETSTDALLHGLDSDSPTIRIHAAASLKDRPNLPRVAKAIVAYSKRETWTRGLRHAYQILATTSAREGADTLYAIIEGENDDRATMALKAINVTRSGALSLRLEPIIFNEGRDLKVRQQAIQALAWTEGTAGEALLIDMTRGTRSVPVELREAATRALGSRRSPAALQALLDVVDDPDPVAIQRAAIRVLAYYPADQALPKLNALRGQVDERTERTLKRTINAIKTRETLRDTRKKVNTIKGL